MNRTCLSLTPASFLYNLSTPLSYAYTDMGVHTYTLLLWYPHMLYILKYVPLLIKKAKLQNHPNCLSFHFLISDNTEVFLE